MIGAMACESVRTLGLGFDKSVIIASERLSQQRPLLFSKVMLLRLIKSFSCERDEENTMELKL